MIKIKVLYDPWTKASNYLFSKGNIIIAPLLKN
jgi:hypothetical protein